MTDILEITCPKCGAKGTPPDAPKRNRCRTLTTKRTTDTHVARWDACYPPSALYAHDDDEKTRSETIELQLRRAP